MGLEALSRGARHATFIESDKMALKALYDNIALLDVKKQTTVIPGNALLYIKKLKTKFDFIFMDPPYGLKDKGELICTQILHYIDSQSLLEPHGAVLIEEDRATLRNIPKTVLNNLKWTHSRKYGTSILHRFETVAIK